MVFLLFMVLEFHMFLAVLALVQILFHGVVPCQGVIVC